MESHYINLKGVFLPLTTPFKEDMSIDYAGLEKNMESYAESSVHGFLALGSNGENRCLSEEEKRNILKIIVEKRREDQIVMAGCIYDSSVLTIEFMKFAKNTGCDYATLLPPSYFRKQMTHEVLIDYFSECAESVEIPVLLYNAPGFTGVTLQPETVEILSKHPNIAGIKDSAANGIENFCPFMSPDFAVLAGSANFLYTGMVKHGIYGGIISIANAIPAAGVTLFQYGLRGASEQGDRYHEIMKTVNAGVSGKYGVPGVKAAMDLVGLTGSFPRRPLRPLTEEQRADIRKTLEEGRLL